MHPKLDPTRVRTHDIQIMTVNFMSLRCLLYIPAVPKLGPSRLYCPNKLWADVYYAASLHPHTAGLLLKPYLQPGSGSTFRYTICFYKFSDPDNTYNIRQICKGKNPPKSNCAPSRDHRFTSPLYDLKIVKSMNMNKKMLHKKFDTIAVFKFITGSLEVTYSRNTNRCPKSRVHVKQSKCLGWMDERCFRPLLCTVKAALGRGQPGLMR